MTLVDIRPAVPMSPHEHPAAASAIHPLSRTRLDMMRAFFCYEFDVRKLDRESLPTATPDAVAEWVEALAMSGLFAPSELRAMTHAWSREPDALVRLLSGVDETATTQSLADPDRTDADRTDADRTDADVARPARYLRAS